MSRSRSAGKPDLHDSCVGWNPNFGALAFVVMWNGLAPLSRTTKKGHAQRATVLLAHQRLATAAARRAGKAVDGHVKGSKFMLFRGADLLLGEEILGHPLLCDRCSSRAGANQGPPAESLRDLNL